MGNVRTVRFGVSRGIRLDLGSHWEKKKEWGFYEPELQSLYRRYITPLSVVYDVGAADGDTALPMARCASHGYVIAFEADPQMCERFKLNMTLNPDLAERIRLIHGFVGDGGLGPDGKPTLRLDEVSQSLEPDIVKIDVEGAEDAVLQGMTQLFTTKKPILIIETHGMDKRDFVLKFLSEHNYLTHTISGWWRPLYPGSRPLHNRWILGVPQ